MKAVDTPDGITFMFESPNKNKVSDYWMRLTYMQVQFSQFRFV